MNRNLLHATLAMVSTLFCGAAAAEVYTWTEGGNIHFGDRPKYSSEPIEVKTADAGDPDVAADPAADSAADAREENCDKASKRLADYEKADQLVGEDEYGRKRDIIGEERVEVILRAKKDVEEFCGEAAASAPSEPASANPAPATEEVAPQAEAAPAGPAASAETEPAALQGVGSF